MTDKRKYATGAALRAALEERLKQIAKTEGTELQRLRRQVAFDRFLARLFGGVDTQWVLKGGYAMELRFRVARATKDLDFTVRAISTPSGDSVLEYLQEAGRRNLGDFFSFRVGLPMMDLDGAPYGGSRYPVEATIAQRTFVKFHLDVGIGDVVLDPLEHIQTRDWLGFAEIPPLVSVRSSPNDAGCRIEPMAGCHAQNRQFPSVLIFTHHHREPASPPPVNPAIV